VCEPQWKQPVSPSVPLASVSLNDDALAQDWKTCDSYIAYSAELLRISLLAISGLAALCLKINEKSPDTMSQLLLNFRGSLIALILAAGLSLFHRYIAVDSMAFHIESLRRRKRNRPDQTIEGRKIKSDAARVKHQDWFRDLLFRAASWMLLAAALSLIVGIGLAILAMTCV
jgi:hypothetical protein